MQAPPGTPPTPALACVLVNWNHWQDTAQCLASLAVQDYPNLSVIVVDNGSTDDSVAQLRAAHPWVEILELPQNIGFSSGCNAGTRLAWRRGADYIWLLNNDTVAPPSTASAIVRTALANPGAGAIGCVLYFMHDPARVQAWGGGRIQLTTAFIAHFHAPASFAPGNTFFTGASLTLPRRVCEQVGILYEGFFMYCDDADLCLRLHRAGLPLAMATDTAILHKEGASSPKRSPLIDQFATTSTLRLLERAAPVPPLSQAIYLALRLGNRLVRREWANFAAVCRGVRIFLAERDRAFTDRL
jgi:GT2 family glycosyltransferase